MMMTMRTEDLLQLDLGGSFRETFVMQQKLKHVRRDTTQKMYAQISLDSALYRR